MANKTKIVHVAIEADGYKKLEKLAVKDSCSVSRLIRLAIYRLLLEREAV